MESNSRDELDKIEREMQLELAEVYILGWEEAEKSFRNTVYEWIKKQPMQAVQFRAQTVPDLAVAVDQLIERALQESKILKTPDKRGE